MRIDCWDWDIRQAIFATWAALPIDVRQALDHVTFTYQRYPERKAWASAGYADVDICTLPPTTDAAVGVIAHELGHVAGQHHARLHAGEISTQQAEQEADQYVRHWGLARELEARKALVGR